jgi:hypothetical protein
MPNTLKVLALAAVIGLAALLGSVAPNNAASVYAAALQDSISSSE